MKYLLTLLAAFLLSVGSVSAQHTVGFSEPADVEHLLEYRLSDWGYSNFMLDFSSRGSLSNVLENDPMEDMEREARRIDFMVNPGYELYQESEERIFEFSSVLNVGYQNSRDEWSANNDFDKGHDFSSGIIISAELKEYVSPDIFLLVNENVDFSYDYFSRERRQEGTLIRDEEQIQRDFLSISRLGLGIGRIRNVTPVIRAIRLSERYAALSNGDRLSEQQIESAADVFTKYDGYQQRYDRPEKYFWQAMDEATNGLINNLQPFDLFYLTDVLDENTGRRLEGWELAAGGNFRYINNLTRFENFMETPSLNRTENISKAAGPFIRGRWFKNLSLNHQIGFTARAHRRYILDPNATTQWHTEFKAQASWLWTVTDRFLLETQLINHYGDSKLEGGLDGKGWGNNTNLSTDFIYFVENRLALNLGAGYTVSYFGFPGSTESFDRRVTGLNFRAGIQYYFSRHLY